MHYVVSSQTQKQKPNNKNLNMHDAKCMYTRKYKDNKNVVCIPLRERKTNF